MGAGRQHQARNPSAAPRGDGRNRCHTAQPHDAQQDEGQEQRTLRPKERGAICPAWDATQWPRPKTSKSTAPSEKVSNGLDHLRSHRLRRAGAPTAADPVVAIDHLPGDLADSGSTGVPKPECGEGKVQQAQENEQAQGTQPRPEGLRLAQTKTWTPEGAAHCALPIKRNPQGVITARQWTAGWSGRF